MKWDWLKFEEFLPIAGEASAETLLEELSTRENVDWLVILMDDPDDESDTPKFQVVPRAAVVDRFRNPGVLAKNVSVARAIQGLPSRYAIVATASQAARIIEENTDNLGVLSDKMLVRVDVDGDLTGVAEGLTIERVFDPGSLPNMTEVNRVWSSRNDRILGDTGIPISLPGIHDMMETLPTVPISAERPVYVPPTPTKLVLSADAPETVVIGEEGTIDFKLSLAGDVNPLAYFETVAAKSEDDITVILATGMDLLDVEGVAYRTVTFPKPGAPTEGSFRFVADRLGTSTIGLHFMQNGADIGSLAIKFTVQKTWDGEARVTKHAQSTAQPGNDPVPGMLRVHAGIGTGDDAADDSVRFRYVLNSQSLRLDNVRADSRPLPKDRSQLIEEAQKSTDTITQNVRKLKSSSATYHNDLKAQSLLLSDLVFHPGFLEQFWPRRKKISSLRLTSTFGPIPHELAIIPSPDGNELDDKHLCEYGLVRTVGGDTPPTDLVLNKIAYLNARYENDTYDNVDGLDPFSIEFEKWAKSTEFVEVAPNTTALLDVLKRADYDALHVTCHGLTRRNNALRTEIVVGDFLNDDGKKEAHKIGPHNIKVALVGNSEFRKRRPIIFFNACESSRPRQTLNLWQGWADTFMEAGAGAFIGTAWPVRNAPAVKFANAFYTALKSGSTLSEASSAARQAAKIEDASWLAYRVYGDPSAKLVG